jgi:hypothetical protein
MSSQLHVPAALAPGRELPMPIGQEAGCASDPVWTIWIILSSCSALDLNCNLSVIQCVSSRYNYCATSASSGRKVCKKVIIRRVPISSLSDLFFYLNPGQPRTLLRLEL